MAQSHPWLVFILLMAIATGYARDLRQGEHNKTVSAADQLKVAKMAQHQL